jgi:hypothetical protein
MSLAVTVVTVLGVSMPSAQAAPGAVDLSTHQYEFDLTLSDSAGGPSAVLHGTVPYAPGRSSSADPSDRSLVFDGERGDYVSIPAPVFAYGAADFTIDFWMRTSDDEPSVVLDTNGGCRSEHFGVDVTLTGAGTLRLGVGRGSGGTDDRGGVGGEEWGPEAQRAEPGSGKPTAGHRVDDGRWHDITVTRTERTVLLEVDGIGVQGVTTARVLDFRGMRPSFIGRGCGDLLGFEGNLDDLTSYPQPHAEVPEAPFAILLPIGAFTVGGWIVTRRRRRGT